ncbi:hypothetical protein OAK87_01390 [bacterium]|nr:hypothetical protein [bacterium]
MTDFNNETPEEQQARIEKILGFKAPVRTKEELKEHQQMAQARYQLDMLRTDMAFEAGELEAESPDDFTIYI